MSAKSLSDACMKAGLFRKALRKLKVCKLESDYIQKYDKETLYGLVTHYFLKDYIDHLSNL